MESEDLKWGDSILFEMWGGGRPVAFFEDFLDKKKQSLEAEIKTIMQKAYIMRYLKSQPQPVDESISTKNSLGCRAA